MGKFRDNLRSRLKHGLRVLKVYPEKQILFGNDRQKGKSKRCSRFARIRPRSQKRDLGHPAPGFSFAPEGRGCLDGKSPAAGLELVFFFDCCGGQAFHRAGDLFADFR
jgi:hypothetical protein